MKFPKQDIPESVFLELFVEDFFFCFPKSEPVTIFLDEFFSIVFSYPVAEIVPNHCSNDGERDSDEEMITRPESSYEDHNIHPWNRSSDDWQWLNTCRKKSNEIIPVPNRLDNSPNPYKGSFYPLFMHQWDDYNGKSQEGQEDSDKFCDDGENSLDSAHRWMIQKSQRSARRKQKIPCRRDFNHILRLLVGFIFSMRSEEDREVHEEDDEEEASPNPTFNYRGLVLVGSFCEDSCAGISFTFADFFFRAYLAHILSWIFCIWYVGWIFAGFELITMTTIDVLIIRDNHPFNPIIPNISIPSNCSNESNQGCKCQIEAEHRESIHTWKDKN